MDATELTSSKSKRVAIMQPTFMPWLGYFVLMDSVDQFVLLDDVQFDRRSWQQRNYIKSTKNEKILLTVPVLKKGMRDQLINEVTLSDDFLIWCKKSLTTIKQCYSRATNFNETFPIIENIFMNADSLMSLNHELIKFFKQILKIETNLILSSTCQHTGAKEDLLLSLCSQLDAKVYVSPLGSKGYLDDNKKFNSAGIALTFTGYVPKRYTQLGAEFIPYLSVLDFVMNAESPDIEFKQHK